MRPDQRDFPGQIGTVGNYAHIYGVPNVAKLGSFRCIDIFITFTKSGSRFTKLYSRFTKP